MEQRITPDYKSSRYWVLFFFNLLVIMNYIYRIQVDISMSRLLDMPYIMDAAFVVYIPMLFLFNVLAIILLLTRQITEIIMEDNTISVRRKIGATIYAASQDVTIFATSMQVGKHFRFNLYDIKNFDKIKEFLSPYAKVIHNKKRSWVVISFIILIIIIPVIIAVFETILKITYIQLYWIFNGFFACMNTIMIFSIVRSLFIK